MLVKGEDQPTSTSSGSTPNWSATAPEGYNRLAPKQTNSENTSDTTTKSITDNGGSTPTWSDTPPGGNNPLSPVINDTPTNTPTTNTPTTNYREETKTTKQTINKQEQQSESEYSSKREEAFKNANYGVVGNIKDNTTRKIGDYYYTKDRFGHWVKIDKNFTPVDINKVEREASKRKIVDIDTIDFESPTGVRVMNPTTGRVEVGVKNDNGEWVARSLIESALPEATVKEDNGYGDPFTALVDVGADNYGKSRKEEIVYLWPDTPVIYLPGFNEKSPGYDKVKHARTIGGADLSIGYYDPTNDVFIVSVNMPSKKPGEKGELEDFIDPYLWNDFIGEQGRKNLIDSIIWPETNSNTNNSPSTPSIHGPFTPGVLYDTKTEAPNANKTGMGDDFDKLPGYDLFGFHVPMIVPTWMQEGTTAGDVLKPVQKKASDVNEWANRDDIAPFIYMPGLVVGLTDNPASSVQLVDDIIAWGGKSAVKTGKKVDAWLWQGSGKGKGIFGDDAGSIGGSRTIMRNAESESSVPHIDLTEHIDLTGRTDLEIQHGFHYGERPSMDASLYNSESIIEGVPYGYKYVPENPVGQRIVKIVDDFDINAGPMGNWKNLRSPLDEIEADGITNTRRVFDVTGDKSVVDVKRNHIFGNDDTTIFDSITGVTGKSSVKSVNVNTRIPVYTPKHKGGQGASIFNKIFSAPSIKTKNVDGFDWDFKLNDDWGWSKPPTPVVSTRSKPNYTPDRTDVDTIVRIPDPFNGFPDIIVRPPPIKGGSGGDTPFPKIKLPGLSDNKNKHKKRYKSSGLKWLNDTDSWFDHAITGKKTSGGRKR
jgi:hypothetical protein